MSDSSHIFELCTASPVCPWYLQPSKSRLALVRAILSRCKYRSLPLKMESWKHIKLYVGALSEKQTRWTGNIYITAEQVQILVAMSCAKIASITIHVSDHVEAALRSQNRNHRLGIRNLRTEEYLNMSSRLFIQNIHSAVSELTFEYYLAMYAAEGGSNRSMVSSNRCTLSAFWTWSLCSPLTQFRGPPVSDSQLRRFRENPLRARVLPRVLL